MFGQFLEKLRLHHAQKLWVYQLLTSQTYDKSHRWTHILLLKKKESKQITHGFIFDISTYASE